MSGWPVGWDIDLEQSSDQWARCMGDVRQGQRETVSWRAIRSVRIRECIATIRKTPGES